MNHPHVLAYTAAAATAGALGQHRAALHIGATLRPLPLPPPTLACALLCPLLAPPQSSASSLLSTSPTLPRPSSHALQRRGLPLTKKGTQTARLTHQRVGNLTHGTRRSLQRSQTNHRRVPLPPSPSLPRIGQATQKTHRARLVRFGFHAPPFLLPSLYPSLSFSPTPCAAEHAELCVCAYVRVCADVAAATARREPAAAPAAVAVVGADKRVQQRPPLLSPAHGGTRERAAGRVARRVTARNTRCRGGTGALLEHAAAGRVAVPVMQPLPGVRAARVRVVQRPRRP